MKNKKHVSTCFLSLHKFTMNILLVHFPGSINQYSLVFENETDICFCCSIFFFFFFFFFIQFFFFFFFFFLFLIVEFVFPLQLHIISKFIKEIMLSRRANNCKAFWNAFLCLDLAIVSVFSVCVAMAFLAVSIVVIRRQYQNGFLWVWFGFF